MRGTVLFEAQAFESERAAGRDGRCRERGAALDALVAQLEIPASVAAAQSADGLRRRRGRRDFSRARLERIVVLAVFLPVLAGQSGNTGCQALAVTLRGITLGELTPDKARALVGKEALLGFCNGALVGISAGLGMLVYATHAKESRALGSSR